MNLEYYRRVIKSYKVQEGWFYGTLTISWIPVLYSIADPKICRKEQFAQKVK